MIDDRTRYTRRTTLAMAAGGLAGVAGCLGDDPQDDANGAADADAGDADGDDDSEAEGETDDGDAEYTVATSFLALWDLTRQVAGDHMAVVDLVPTGEHGHDFDPGPDVVNQIEDADVFVYLRDFASWQDDAAAELADDEDVRVIEAASEIEFFDSPADDHDEHFWMDPLECRHAVDTIADELGSVDPDNAGSYEDNAAAFSEELAELHEEFEEIVERADHDQLVVGTHDSFQWWNRRYGLEIHSPVGTSPDNEASPQEVAEIESVIEEYDLEYVLYDVGEPDTLAESIAAETDAEVLPISPVETQLPEYDEADWGYVDHYREVNFPSLEDALDA